MTSYPASIATVNHVAAAPRRVRGIAGGQVIFDTTRALYVWEWPPGRPGARRRSAIDSAGQRPKPATASR
jgi:hypothetical protein